MVISTYAFNFPVGGGSLKCTPFISMYSDCTPENRCDGCNRCTCSAHGAWVCESTTDGCEDDQEDDKTAVDDRLMDAALDEMMLELQSKLKKPEKKRYVPEPSPPPDTILVRKINKVPAWDDYNESATEDESFVIENLRKKRSVESKKPDKKGNKTIKFHHTVNEINEDTLKNTNTSGTLPATKIDVIPMVSRRSSTLSNASMPLQIEYSPPLQSQHAADNKVDTPALHDDHLDLLVHHKIYKTIGNQSQASRDKDLSKLVVNELQGGVAETIGDKNSPFISNITFTPENDTLTAMAFIAGNLLNKLWNIEKDNDDSLEIEHMKHRKIDDLLDLFKEPLNLRQETFLKNALQHLSTAIENKNIGNVSLCENIEELKKISGITDEPMESKSILKLATTVKLNKLPEISEKTAATEALNKISNILDLIKKYESTQNALNDLKNSSNFNSTDVKSLNKEEKTNDLTKDEKSTLNVFGNILESLTKLLIPNKKGKKLIKRVKSKNSFISDKDVKGRFANPYLTDVPLTTKDKIVLDYLTHIQNNPNCVLNKNQEKALLPDTEGDILLNLSKFFKIKSMPDLLKLINTENNKEANFKRTETTKSDMSLYENLYTTEPIIIKTKITEKDNIKIRLESTKQKLKDDLKAILEDLIELQNISGRSINGKKIGISEALPCIYNLLNNKNVNSNDQQNTNSAISLTSSNINKISEIVKNLKKELKQTTSTRRTNVRNGKIPKSAIVWERTVKNLGNKNKFLTRRNLQDDASKTFDDVKTIINQIESSGSNTYKSIAYLADVPPAERLLLLKTLDLDTKRYISILSDIIKYIEVATTLPLDQYNTISEFLGNVDINLNLNRKVVNSLDKPKNDLYLSNREISPRNTLKDYAKQNRAKEVPTKTVKAYSKKNEAQTKTQHVYSRTKEAQTETVNIYGPTKEVEIPPSGYSNVKLNRDQIINQLIKNRIKYYLKLKEETGDHEGDINTELARKILLYLEIGNDNLARELFKIFVSQKKKMPFTSSDSVFDSVRNDARMGRIDKRKSKIPEPLIQFEDPTENKESWMNQDPLMKQLINIKNLMV